MSRTPDSIPGGAPGAISPRMADIIWERRAQEAAQRRLAGGLAGYTPQGSNEFVPFGIGLPRNVVSLTQEAVPNPTVAAFQGMYSRRRFHVPHITWWSIRQQFSLDNFASVPSRIMDGLVRVFGQQTDSDAPKPAGFGTRLSESLRRRY